MTIKIEERPSIEERVSYLEGAYGHLATKEDVANLRTAIVGSETRVAQRVAGSETHVAQFIAESETRVAQRIAESQNRVARLIIE